MSSAELFGRASLVHLEEDLEFLMENGLQPEVYLPASALDDPDKSRLDPLIRFRETGGDVSLHAPFMDLSPGGLDPRVLDVTRYRFSQVRKIVEVIQPRHVVFIRGTTDGGTAIRPVFGLRTVSRSGRRWWIGEAGTE